MDAPTGRLPRPATLVHHTAEPHVVGRLMLPLVLILAVASAAGRGAADDTTDQLTYEGHIFPLFRTHCFDCHGAAEEMQGGLDLRQMRRMVQGGESGPAIVPGNADQSYLVQRVRSGEMPPGDARLSDAEISTLERWIALGAPTARPEPESIAPGIGITQEDRDYWAFQPIRRPPIDFYSEQERVRTPIDALLLSAMPQGLGFAADASRETLVKRAYLDLVGLPPGPEEMQRWLSDSTEEWYSSLINELLASARYGERWARHWLDVAGYADSEGYNARDTERPWSWKYRDYVIRSFNADKPFDRFIVEQLAGDELAGPRDGDWNEDQIELLTATGFLRMGADGSGSGADDSDSRNQVMVETLKIVSSSLLGLSVGCAQCHDHRYDPIPHSDYYALRAVFEPALDWRAWRTPEQRRVSLYTAAELAEAERIEVDIQKVYQEQNAQETKYMEQALTTELEAFEPPLRDRLRSAYETPGDKRTDEQHALLDGHPQIKINSGNLYQYISTWREEQKAFEERANKVRATKPKEEFLRALVEPEGHAPPTHLFHRGEHQQPQDIIMPAALTVLCTSGDRFTIPTDDDRLPSTGRRLNYARWLTSGRHPLVARVVANRVWMHHFGRAIVDTPGEFGRLGMQPTHPELLDWLADELMRRGWSLKQLHRTIMLSTAYRQSATRTSEADALDPDNHFYSRKSMMRLEAETIRDRMLFVSGSLSEEMGGPSIAVTENDSGQFVVDGAEPRRSVYIQSRRSHPVAMLRAFDSPLMVTNCERRTSSTVATQSLMLMNGEFTLQQAAKLAQRATSEAPALTSERVALAGEIPDADSVSDADSDSDQSTVTAPSSGQVAFAGALHAWSLAYCREPDQDEMRIAVRFLADQVEYWQQHTDDLPEEVDVYQQALTNLCHAMLSSNEFLYVD